MVSQFSFFVALTWQTFKAATKIYCHYQFGLWPKNKTNIYSRLRKSSRRSFFPQESKCPPTLTHTRSHVKKLTEAEGPWRHLRGVNIRMCGRNSDYISKPAPLLWNPLNTQPEHFRDFRNSLQQTLFGSSWQTEAYRPVGSVRGGAVGGVAELHCVLGADRGRRRRRVQDLRTKKIREIYQFDPGPESPQGEKLNVQC